MLMWFGVQFNWNRIMAVAGLEALKKHARNVMPKEVNFCVSNYNCGKPGIEGLYYSDDASMRAAIAPLLGHSRSLGQHYRLAHGQLD